MANIIEEKAQPCAEHDKTGNTPVLIFLQEGDRFSKIAETELSHGTLKSGGLFIYLAFKQYFMAIDQAYNGMVTEHFYLRAIIIAAFIRCRPKSGVHFPPVISVQIFCYAM